MRDCKRLANWPAVLPRIFITLTALAAPLTVTFAQGTEGRSTRSHARERYFATVSGGGFYTIAGDNWYVDAGLGVGREVVRNIALEIGISHSPLQTPANRFGLGAADVYFDTPVTNLTLTARVTLPFAPVLFVGAGAGVLRFDGSDDGVGTFTAATTMWILGVQKNVTRRVFARAEGHRRVDRHPPFNGINGEIIGVVGLRF